MIRLHFNYFRRDAYRAAMAQLAFNPDWDNYNANTYLKLNITARPVLLNK
ncbi:MAG: hypothetical protein ACLFPF_11120 [Halanaerobiales bacterium]